MRFPLSLLTLSLFSAAALAEQQPEGIEHIEVKGDFRQHSLQRIASSVSAVSEQDIKRTSSQHLDELLNQFANVNLSAGASRGRFLQVRGIGERSEFVDTVNPSVGILVDGIDYSGLGFSGLSGIEQLEVFRGPEATRFGANALAGMLNITSKQPSFTPEGKISASLANYDSWQLAANYSNALSQKVAYSFALEQQTSDGFIDNAYLNRDDTNNIDEFSGRFKLHYLATDNLTLRLIAHLTDQDNGYDAFSLDRNRTTLSDEPGRDMQRSKALALAADYSGLAFADMQTQLSWLNADMEYRFDEDWGYVGIHPDEYSTTDHYVRQRKQLTLDYRLLSKPAGRIGDSTDWVTGIYASDKEFDLTRYSWDWDAGEPGQFGSNLRRRNLAFYGELSTALSEQLTLISGVRVEQYDDEYTDSATMVIDSDETMWGARLGLNYQVNAQAMMYLLASRGYKAGGVNGEALAKAEDSALNELRSKASFKSETLWNAEVGVKGSSPDQRLISRVAAFYMWRDDMQVKGWLNPDAGPQFAGFIDNAGSGRNYGLEMENRIQWLDSVALFVNGSWLKSKLGHYITLDGDDLSGREQAHAPRFQYSVAADWYLTEQLIFNVSVQGKDAFYYSDGHNARSKRYELVNMRLSYQLPHWEFALWARNVLDKDIGIRGFYFGNDPRDGYATHTYEQFAEPRRIGVTASYQF
ncbi:TonB-dependent receptor [Chromatiaceae bacterium AAb-1]|nr:TonB-dependent receptor [Chromatiaceae bacterium AAb-1]